MQFTCYVTRRDGIVRRVEVQAADILSAARAAIAGVPQSVCASARAAS